MDYMKDIVNDIGESITLKIVSQGGPNKWGASDETTTTTIVEGVFQIMSAEDDDVKEGRFQAGDLQAFFKESVSNIKEENKIVYNEREYEIKEVINEPDISGNSHLQVRASVI